MPYKDRAKASEQMKRWRAANKERVAALMNLYSIEGRYRKGGIYYKPRAHVPGSRRQKPGQLSGRDVTREKVRERDNHTCQGCKKKWIAGTRRFDVHHLNGLCGRKSRKYDRIEDMDGLITLCHSCHYNRHDFNGYR